MRFINTILDLVFPQKCASCGAPGSDLCLACISNFPHAERETAKWIFPLYDYRHPAIKKALWVFKYKNKKRLAPIFAGLLYGKIMEELSEMSLMENFENSVLIPIPLSKERMRERGYNQTELICQELIKLDKGENFSIRKNILFKPKDTEHQARIKDKSERLKNIIGSFAVKNAGKIAGRNIILVDDIATSGATLSEARKVLKNSGARKIIAFTVAH